MDSANRRLDNIGYCARAASHFDPVAISALSSAFSHLAASLLNRRGYHPPMAALAGRSPKPEQDHLAVPAVAPGPEALGFRFRRREFCFHRFGVRGGDISR